MLLRFFRFLWLCNNVLVILVILRAFLYGRFIFRYHLISFDLWVSMQWSRILWIGVINSVLLGNWLISWYDILVLNIDILI